MSCVRVCVYIIAHLPVLPTTLTFTLEFLELSTSVLEERLLQISSRGQRLQVRKLGVAIAASHLRVARGLRHDYLPRPPGAIPVLMFVSRVSAL